jgi:NADPH-dependent 2,4-dienoyl-CoA reductase/sulfur reductase-like enzyme
LRSSDNDFSCDAAIVGAGPAGIAAACRIAEAGRTVVILDEGLGPGGQIWRPKLRGLQPKVARHWIARLQATSAILRESTSVYDVARESSGKFVLRAEAAGSAVSVRADRVVLATGARERFLPFPGWTLPNVVGIGGAQALLKTGMDVAGLRIVIAGSGPLLLPVAASLARAGARLWLVAEQASAARVRRFATSLWRRPGTLIQAATLRTSFLRTRYATGTWVTSAAGDAKVRDVTVTNGRTTETIGCDLLCVAFGLVPNTSLARLVGCDVARGTVRVDASLETSVPNVYCVGEPTGVGGVDKALVEGEIAGFAAVGLSVPQGLALRRAALEREMKQLEVAFALRPEVTSLAQPETIVCRCEDVRLRDLDPRWASRQAKLYTRAGMGPCQGRICGAALESMLGWTPDSVRPPVQPTRLDAFLSDPHVSSSPEGVR